MNKQEAENPLNRHFVHKPTGQRWRRNGKTKLLKRDNKRFQIPVKHGLYSYGYINEGNASEFVLE